MNEYILLYYIYIPLAIECLSEHDLDVRDCRGQSCVSLSFLNPKVFTVST